jgi:large subunit ribosomal protein L4
MAVQTAEREELRTVTVERRNAAGEVLGTVELASEIFGRTPNVPLMHQIVTAQLAARRSGTHSTKTRAEVRGGGAKPYRQKGTGRARQGTIRAPQFEGGGVALGPKPRSYKQHSPRKMTRLALYSALSDRAAEGRICLVDGWAFDFPKTKDAIAAINALGLEGNVLVVLGNDDHAAERSFANLPEVDLVDAAQLTAYDVLVNDWVVFTDATIPGEVVASEASPSATETVASVDDSPASPAESAAPKPRKATAKAAKAAAPEAEAAAPEAEAAVGEADEAEGEADVSAAADDGEAEATVSVADDSAGDLPPTDEEATDEEDATE